MAVSREQIVQSAEKYVARGKIEPAIREYRKLLAENPNDINTLNRVGDLYARIQRNDEAIDFFTQIAEQYTAEGFFVKAIAIYKKIIKLDPTRLEVYEQLAELYGKQGLINEARTQYQVLADYYQKHDNAASAIAIYQKMAQLEPDNPTYHVKLAEIYHQQQLIEKAMGEYRVIAELMLQHGRPQEAAQVYERALDIDSQNLVFIEEAADRLRGAGHAAGADHFLVIAVERNPKAQEIARRPQPAQDDRTTRTLDLAPEPDVDVIAEPEPPRRRAAPPEPEEPDDQLDLTFGGDDLARAMAEAEAAVAGAPARAAAPAADAADEIELDLELDLDLADVFEVDLPDEDEAPSSLVRPPADLLEAPRRPAWSQEAGQPVEAASPASPTSPVTEPEAEVELSLDDDAFLLPEIEIEPASAVEEPAEPALELEPEAEAATQEAEREEDLVSEAEVLAKYGLEDKAVERLGEALRLRPDHLQALALLLQIHLGKGHHTHVVELANRMAGAAERKKNRDPWQKVRKKLLDAGYRLDGDHVASGPQVARISASADQVDELLRGLVDKAPATPRPRPAAPPAAPPEPMAPSSPPAPPPPPLPAGRAIFNPLQIADLVEREGEEVDWLPVEESVLPGKPAPPQLVSDFASLDDTGSMSWLDEADRTREEKAAGGAGGAEASAAELFAEEDDFFDLAGELVEELSKEEVFQRDGVMVQAEQTLEEIVEGFKKGVAEHLSPTDYDTHFNLGIAYREMGLLDEAIGEFQLAAKDVRYFVLCCSMLGLCFLDKGLPELAIKWYRRALEAPGISEDDSLGMLYDLGNVYMQMGDQATAYKTFVDLYGINSNYRDVVAKLEELGRPR